MLIGMMFSKCSNYSIEWCIRAQVPADEVELCDIDWCDKHMWVHIVIMLYPNARESGIVFQMLYVC